MSMTTFTESIVEDAALAWLESLGWRVKHGLEIAPGEPGAERVDYAQAKCAGRTADQSRQTVSGYGPAARRYLIHSDDQVERANPAVIACGDI